MNFNRTIQISSTYNSGPQSVAIGDFNKDTWLDIVVANKITSNIDIYIASDKGSFSKQFTYSTGSNSAPHMVAVGDFNNDDRLDIAVANFDSNNIGLFRGFGNGSFSIPVTYLTGYDSFPSSLVSGDFNNDNHIDIAIANYATDNIGIMYGNGNNTFINQTMYSTGSYPSSVAISDFNDDAQMDIVVTNDLVIMSVSSWIW